MAFVIDTCWRYAGSKPKYEISFYDADGTLLGKQIVKKGQTPVFSGSTPKYNGWTFKGWAPAMGPVEGPMSYYASYQIVANVLEETCPYSWEQICQFHKDGTYRQKLSLGMSKIAPCGTYDPGLMELIGFDQDSKSGGSKVKTSWSSKNIIGTGRWGTPSTTASWSSCSLRNTMSALIDDMLDVLQENIVPVIKISERPGSGQTISTSDYIWLLGATELGVLHNTGNQPDYTEFYDTATSYKKCDIKGTAKYCWTRSRFNDSSYNVYVIGTAGGCAYSSMGTTNTNYGFNMGFSLD